MPPTRHHPRCVSLAPLALALLVGCPTGEPLDAEPRVAAGGFHTCAVAASGGVLCWGNNDQGQLGDGTTDPRPAPVEVADLIDAGEVTAGETHTCAIRASGLAVCWGQGYEATPRAVKGFKDAAQIDGGGAFRCAVRDGGEAVCWGVNTHGQLGDGSRFGRTAPARVDGLPAVRGLALGKAHTCITGPDALLWCFGRNGEAQLGFEGEDRLTPAPVAGLSEVLGVAAGGAHTCALQADQVVCFGHNARGQLGRPRTRPGTTRG